MEGLGWDVLMDTVATCVAHVAFAQVEKGEFRQKSPPPPPHSQQSLLRPKPVFLPIPASIPNGNGNGRPDSSPIRPSETAARIPDRASVHVCRSPSCRFLGPAMAREEAVREDEGGPGQGDQADDEGGEGEAEGGGEGEEEEGGEGEEGDAEVFEVGIGGRTWRREVVLPGLGSAACYPFWLCWRSRFHSSTVTWILSMDGYPLPRRRR